MTGRQVEKRKARVAAAMAAGLIAATGAFIAGNPQPPATPPSIGTASQQSFPPPLAEGPAPDLDLVFTAQVIGWIEPCG